MCVCDTALRPPETETEKAGAAAAAASEEHRPAVKRNTGSAKEE